MAAPQGPGLSPLKQGLVLAGVAAGVLLLMPCSPLSLWGSAFCPVTPATVSGPITDPSFVARVVEPSRNRPVLVQFHADWCGPCKRLAPEINALERARGERLAVVRIDVDAEAGVAQELGVSSIPDLRLWRDGQEVARSLGYRSQSALAAWIDQHTGKP